ncbi:DNA methyltransferase [Spirochaetia bacterium]|nr:DNA methyltransferase [Spirochaetia bacterium]
MSTPVADIAHYLTEVDKLYRAGNATEHSYRPALKGLFEKITTGLTITNEPKHIECGAPDYIITKGNIPLGYIEAKDIKIGVNNKLNKEQFDRYKQSLGNLIITDYLTFQLFVEGELITSVTLANVSGNTITPDKKQFAVFLELINQFTSFSGKTIYHSEQLAKMMADKAKLLAEIIKTALNEKIENDTLAGQYEGFKTVLLHNLATSEFADIYAQTLAYGLFAARLNQTDNQPFTRYLAAQLIPQSNPFLRKFFNYIAGIELDSRITWIVDALADLFNCVAVEDIRKEFGKASQDPYIHFYETFLAEYDPALRESRGVYYTPVPVVKFIVQAVDDILKNEFGLKNGLADYSKIRRTITGKDDKPETVELHKVQILDPATGTGTFLAEVIDKIYSYFEKNKGVWADYSDKHLIPRLNGFEILMASYAMAHFKLDMKLKETGYTFKGDSRLQVYLTNSLEEPDNKLQMNMQFIQWLTQEANEASKVKRDAPVMVILGNPPYSGESANITSNDFLAPYKKEPGGIDKLKEKNSKWINDDYVKFIRYGQSFIEKYGDGVLAYITNHSFLDNPTFRGMRWHLLKTFDKIYILDLHGNSKKKEAAPDGSKDENVFDIQQGVSINIFIKTGNKKADELAAVYHYDMYGERETKYQLLLENTLSTINWNILPVEGPQYFFIEKDFTNKALYEKGFLIPELFTANSAGIVTARDEFTIHNSAEALKETITRFLSMDNETARAQFNLGKDVRDWSVTGARKDLVPNPDKEPKPNFDRIVKINYRPFDIRYTYYTGHSKGFHCMPRGDIMRHFIVGENIGLVFKRGFTENAAPVFVTNKIIDFRSWSRPGMQGGDYLAPLYIYPFESPDVRNHNLNKDIISVFSEKTGLSFTAEKQNGENTFAPIDILDYIYAVLYSNKYRVKYKEFLKIDFPRIPYPANVEEFRTLSSIGSILRSLHLMENVNPDMDTATFPVSGSNEIEKQLYADNKVQINKTQYFDSIPLEVWEYYIGGYQPAQKWLKDRKGRILSFEDIEHYQKIIVVLKMTMELQQQIDEVIN